MRIAWGVILLFSVRFAVQAWFDPRNNADLYWQQWLGQQILQLGHLPLSLGSETVTSAGAAWVPQEWALSLAVAWAAQSHAFWVLALIVTLCGALTLAITGWSARRLGASQIGTALCVTCVGFSMVESYGVRAQVFAWLLLAACFYVVRCARGNAKFWIVPLTAIWANLHASAMLAPALLAIWTTGVALDEKRLSPNVRQALLLTAGAAAAVCLTPLGIHLPAYALQLFTSPIRSSIQEWQPSALTSDSFIAGALPLIVFGCLAGMGRRRRELAVFIACAWLAFSAVRNIPVCAIVIGPFVAARLSLYLPERLRINQIVRERAVAGLAYAFFIPCAFLMTWNLARAAHFQVGRLPVAAIRAAAAQPGIHSIYCEDWAWCSLALSHPNMREFMDGRCDPFPLAVWHEYEVVYRVRPQWDNVLERNGIDQVLVKRGRPLARALSLRSGWHVLYADSRYKLFVRDGAPSTAYQ
jgi:hypothetical protein